MWAGRRRVRARSTGRGQSQRAARSRKQGRRERPRENCGCGCRLRPASLGAHRRRQGTASRPRAGRSASSTLTSTAHQRTILSQRPNLPPFTRGKVRSFPCSAVHPRSTRRPPDRGCPSFPGLQRAGYRVCHQSSRLPSSHLGSRRTRSPRRHRPSPRPRPQPLRQPFTPRRSPWLSPSLRPGRTRKAPPWLQRHPWQRPQRQPHRARGTT